MLVKLQLIRLNTIIFNEQIKNIIIVPTTNDVLGGILESVGGWSVCPSVADFLSGT